MIYLLRQTRQADLIHIVASIRRPFPLVGTFLRTWRKISKRPLIHTALSVGDDAVRTAHFPGDYTVVVTEFDRQRLTHAGVGQVERILPPLDWASLVTKASPSEAAESFQLGERAILYPGHYGPHGGVAECIRAFARLPADLDDVVLVLACRTYPHQDPVMETRHARDLAASLGVGERLRVVGEVEDMAGLISACVLTVLVPSRMEGKMAIPLVLLESLALERPIVTSSEPPLSEALFSGGLAVQPGDIDALASALSRLLSDPTLRDRLGDAGKEAVRQECAPEKAVQKYSEIYQRLVANNERTEH